ncbi:sigma-70 family RNA polymerase sigma factor [Nocardioides sp. L-11A]|uniref:sigma-70 family RNA polymerase sigma factor n=1 Tax=Nocardioides sp. L-11A TaxID=3043848 RepID=UPI00249BFA24|nr:sigma-70 family RNA polymerase sigma factor [Nocardioides sp. L-11A]
MDRVRRGDEPAFDVLFVRHRAYALGVARRVVGHRDAEDAVADAFARIFAIIKNGGGPTTTFRPYLSVTVHNVAVNRLRGQSRELTTEPNDLIPLLIEDDASGQHLTNRVVRDAFTTLPARWQQVLWLCEVDRVPHEEVGDLLGIKPNAVAALALRARRGLADAYLAQYAQAAGAAECTKVVSYLPGYVNGHLARSRREVVDRHVRDCGSCAVAIIELGEARRDVSALLAPLALSVAASGAAGTAAAGGIGAVLGGSTGKSLTAVLASTAVAGAVVGVALAAVRMAAPDVTDVPVTTARTQTGAAASPAPSVHPRTDRRPPRAASRAAPRVAAPVGPSGRDRSVDELDGALGSAAAEPTPLPPRAEAPAVPPSSTLPSPTDTPTDTPTAGAGDPRLAVPAWGTSPAGPAWRRVTVRVDGDGHPVQVVISGVGATRYCLAVGDAAADACASRPGNALWVDTVLAGSGTTQLTVDVKAAQATYLSFGIVGVEGRDADPGNNERAISVPSPGRDDAETTGSVD